MDRSPAGARCGELLGFPAALGVIRRIVFDWGNGSIVAKAQQCSPELQALSLDAVGQ